MKTGACGNTFVGVSGGGGGAFDEIWLEVAGMLLLGRSRSPSKRYRQRMECNLDMSSILFRVMVHLSSLLKSRVESGFNVRNAAAPDFCSSAQLFFHATIELLSILELLYLSNI